ncbi:hypothetical protein BIV57_03270 [Mangrovactinospora gilvigrisea]|uniref:Short-chain dehydrogenase n=1 Tax=Mangrovactinospora gilvigrisea TaxID=1428644 RepID=A0A1J7BJT9_9ACTN|nr:SDR family oxidoreductase [Mangrovactinospora gilvigrisea]OIV38902.1 hypothetical protein BIV57_03270 [Mangrovactinospora gilvigrisea]
MSSAAPAPAPAPASPRGRTAILTGASQGFGRALAGALVDAGARVVGVARHAEDLDAVRADLGPGFVPAPGDAADPATAVRVLDGHAGAGEPVLLILNAGATPLVRHLQDHTWDTFRVAWETDVRQAFEWSRQALSRPLPPGSAVLAVSSGAALGGSPLSGGYAGSKATVRFVAQYAAGESARLGLGIRFCALLPGLTPATRLGAGAVAGFAADQGITAEELTARMGPVLTTEQVAAAAVEVMTDPARTALAYQVDPKGLTAL